MVMESHETKEASSSGESGQRSAERSESSMQEEVSSAKPKMNSQKNEKKPAGRAALKVATSCQFLKQAHQLLRMRMEKSTWEVRGNQPKPTR